MGDKVERDYHQILQFYLADQLFGIDIYSVHRVIQRVAIEPVPGMSEVFEGIINYHGKSVPVINLSWMLHFQDSRIEDIHAAIILCKYKEKFVGILVEKVLDLVTADFHKLQVSQLLAHQAEKFFIGNIITEHGDTLVLNIEKILNLDSIR